MDEKDAPRTTHFGFEEVPVKEKMTRVAGVFTSVANKYDVMNDLMSLGIHRIWKQLTMFLAGVRPGQKVLDLACGTGDLTLKLCGKVGGQGVVVASDINYAMLEKGRARLMDKGIIGNVHYVQANAERLPFPDNYFDHITIGFGLRNVTHIDTALQAMERVLKPGGQVLILEFSQPNLARIRPLYDLYSFNVLPMLGKLIAGDAESYRYLAESIRMHPDQETLKNMMEQAGFAQVEFFNLSGGIVALHRGYKV